MHKQRAGIKSRCNGETVSMTINPLISYYYKKAGEASTEPERQTYLQHAEHYLRQKNK